MAVGRAVEVEFVELVLGEIGDRQLVGARHRAGERREPAGEQLHQSRFAVAVRAEQRDAVVVVDAQRDVAEHRLRGS